MGAASTRYGAKRRTSSLAVFKYLLLVAVPQQARQTPNKTWIVQRERTRSLRPYVLYAWLASDED